MKNIFYLILVGLILIIGSYFFGSYLGKNKYKSEKLKLEYITTIRYIDRPIYITKLKSKIDTIYVVDTLTSIIDTQLVATADTTLIQDSNKVIVKYYFPPKNYFELKLNLKDKVITNEIHTITQYTPTFLDRFNYVIYAGVGYSQNKDVVFSIGLGFGFNLTKIF